MGSSHWSDDYYSSRDADRKARGVDAFTHDADIRTGKTATKVHNKLDPKGVVRESRDSDAHPNSNAIMVWFDETGSMSGLPRVFQQNLPKLHGLLTRKNYIEDPQVFFGCFGDATCDTVPLQVGQFESGNEMEDDLGNMYLEAGGGGQDTESYELAMYFSYHKTSLDCFEKRGKKGYLFMCGDERAYPSVSRNQVEHLIGDKLQEDIPIKDMVAKLKEKFEVFFIIPEGANNSSRASLKTFWRELFGQNVLVLDKPEGITELIAVTIGLAEGSTDLDSAKTHLEEDNKTDAMVVRSVANAVSSYASSTSGLTKVHGSGLVSSSKSKSERL